MGDPRHSRPAVLTALEQRGFVQRAPDPINGRYTLAILTEAGWATVVHAAPGHVRGSGSTFWTR